MYVVVYVSSISNIYNYICICFEYLYTYNIICIRSLTKYTRNLCIII